MYLKTKKGKIMKLFIALSLLLSITAQAELNDTTVLCKRDTKLSCSARTLSAFYKLGCSPIADSIKCIDAATDPLLDPSYRKKMKGQEFCSIQSLCQEPTYGNFGQVSCDYVPTNKTNSVNLKSVDSEITLTTSVGLLQRMVTTLCK